MPELPEVETTRRGIEPHVAGQRVRECIVRRTDLRLPVSETLAEVEGKKITAIRRRSKYLLLETDGGTAVIVHLGMSGSLRIVKPAEPWKKHDHVAFTLGNGRQLRFHDPRRFGLVLQVSLADLQEHPLLKSLGPEPFDEAFDAAYLKTRFANRAVAVKVALMDAKTVVGVGNIYASEALFRAGILPQTPAGKLSKPRLERLVTAIREVLTDSIEQGGTTLRDFVGSDGEPGYFRQRLFVYERKGEPCRRCGTPVRHAVMGQRSTYWCGRCQR